MEMFMKLPELFHPTTDVIVPSTQKTIKMRPMLVKEEKILLMAKMSDTGAEIYNAVKQVVQNCIVNADTNVDELAMFDLDYLFLRLRAISISDKIKLTYIDNDDKKERTFDIDLNKIEVDFPEGIDTKIELGPDEGFLLQYPKAAIYNTETFRKEDITGLDLMDELLRGSLVSYFEGDKVYNFKDNTIDEIKEFINNLDIKTYNKLNDWVNNLPSIKHVISYTNDNGVKREIVLNTLNDFFTLV